VFRRRLFNDSVCLIPLCFLLTTTAAAVSNCRGQSLEEELKAISRSQLVDSVRTLGDASRGAILFHQPQLNCSKCHALGKANSSLLGPDLTSLDSQATDEHLIESVLEPSKKIRSGFESISLLTTDEELISGLMVERSESQVVLRDLSQPEVTYTVPTAAIEELKSSQLSLMPAGLMNLLSNKEQFYDLIKFLIEVRDGGKERAAELIPPESFQQLVVPEYESRINHSELISEWNEESFQRGEAIYKRVCANCHGTLDQPGSLPNSLRFGEGKFKNGSDPLSMYRTMTYGFGLMMPQSWMVPSQKYDVIHYIREAYLKPHNPTQWTSVDSGYLNKLPKGDTRGPSPSNIEVWSAMDYGPSLTHTYEAPSQGSASNPPNIAYKGVAVRLDTGTGGVARGRHWMLFDTDTLRMAAGWTKTTDQEIAKQRSSTLGGQNFIDWRGIQFNGEHGIHPRLVGDISFSNANGPGWGNPTTHSFQDDQRVLGRDERRYGPLPREWGRYKGQYHFGNRSIFSYSIGDTDVLESPSIQSFDDTNLPPVFLRTFHIGPRTTDLYLQVAEHADRNATVIYPKPDDPTLVQLDSGAAKTATQTVMAYDGSTFFELEDSSNYDTFHEDFTVTASIKTTSDGTIWSISDGGEKWIPNGQSLFIRDGKLCFDIGWVGAVQGKTTITDNRWHDIAVSWQKSSKTVQLFVDGKLDAKGALAAKEPLTNPVFRFGFTSPNFPQSNAFQGEMREASFVQKAIDSNSRTFSGFPDGDPSILGKWTLDSQSKSPGHDQTSGKNHAIVKRTQSSSIELRNVTAGIVPVMPLLKWANDHGALHLMIPAGSEPIQFSIWQPTHKEADTQQIDSRALHAAVQQSVRNGIDLNRYIQGGPPRWPDRITTILQSGRTSGAFAIDVLTPPDNNPWLAQFRPTGLDFFSDGRMAVCTWDGDCWIVEEKKSGDQISLQWQRIASGMFQPLGLKIVKEKIYVTCRDQLTILHDLNGDGETDYYECFNNDHQVTEHFHEFAMGLQTDDAGNFYYAKSGCHGKAAIVPHHGTLLQVSADGSQTKILATGFRAANGVCLNPDGSFVVTDQEGFWNPKNRINWVTRSETGEPNFYGNMLGYHNVTDTSDSAMVPPLCWITNEFDRSPAELLWVDSLRWGPLNGSLLNLSYGYGKVFLVPHENVNGKIQGGMIELPIPAFPTGVMRGRFSPRDGQLYLCGMFAWAGNATQPGGLYRLRMTSEEVNLPLELHAKQSGLELKFANAIDPASLDSEKISIKSWGLKRSANYGSPHLDEKNLQIENVSLSPDGHRVTILPRGLEPTWCMEIKYSFRDINGEVVKGTIHNTVHQLSE
jgi:putative heme-binding domain-containing protein